MRAQTQSHAIKRLIKNVYLTIMMMMARNGKEQASQRS